MELKEEIANIGKSFKAFETTNDKRMTAIEKAQEDPSISNKLDKIGENIVALEGGLNDLAISSASSAINSGRSGSKADIEYNGVFSKWFRTGGGEDSVKAAVHKISSAATVESNPDGGFAAPIEWDRTITNSLVEETQMRQFSSHQIVSGQGFKKLYNMHGATSGWVGETDDRPETNTPKLRDYAFSFGEIYSNPKASQRVLEDPELNIEQWLASEVLTEFSLREDDAFLRGDGINRPRGLLTYDTASEGSLDESKRHPLGSIKEITTKKGSGLTASDLLRLAYSLPRKRSKGATYYVSHAAYFKIRDLKDADGRPLWQPSMALGSPATLNGFPIIQMDGLGDVEKEGEIPVLFGNMKETYRVFDRRGVYILRDPYTSKPHVSFYTTKRVGGGVINPEYMRFLRIGA